MSVNTENKWNSNVRDLVWLRETEIWKKNVKRIQAAL